MWERVTRQPQRYTSLILAAASGLGGSSRRTGMADMGAVRDACSGQFLSTGNEVACARRRRTRSVMNPGLCRRWPINRRHLDRAGHGVRCGLLMGSATGFPVAHGDLPVLAELIRDSWTAELRSAPVAHPSRTRTRTVPVAAVPVIKVLLPHGFGSAGNGQLSTPSRAIRAPKLLARTCMTTPSRRQRSRTTRVVRVSSSMKIISQFQGSQ